MNSRSRHIALQFKYKFDHAYWFEASRSFSVNYTTQDSFLDSSRYSDFAATHNIANDFNNQNISPEQYHDSDSICVGDGFGILIQNFDDSHISSFSSSFFICNLLHVPYFTKNLIVVLHFCIDNLCFFKFHSSRFTMNDNKTKNVRLTGLTCNGLYVFPFTLAPLNQPA